MLGDFGQGRQATFVALDRNDPDSAIHQQRARQPTRAGADLDDGGGAEVAGRAGDLPGKVEIEQEILAKRFLGLESVALDDFPQRRQAVDAHRRSASTSASRRASLSAAIRLSGRATPLPAMSKAVP